MTADPTRDCFAEPASERVPGPAMTDAVEPAVRILRKMRLLALGDRNPDFLTHREIDAALQLLPADAECRWVATDDPRRSGAAEPQCVSCGG